MDFSLIFPVDFNTVIMILCALFLFVAHGVKLPTVILSTTFFLSGFAFMILDMLRDRNSYSEGELFIVYDSIGALLLLPLFFSYFFLLMNPDYITRKKIAIVYLPILFVSLLYYVTTLIFGKLPLIRNYTELLPYVFAPEMLIRYLLRLSVPMQSIILGVFAFRMYKRHKSRLQYNFSYTTGVSLSVVPWLVSMIILYSISLFVVSFKLASWISFTPIVMLAAIPLFLSLMAVRQKNIYEKQEEVGETLLEKEEETELPKKQEDGLKKKQLNQLKTRLIESLEKEEIYKDAELSLDKTCRFLGTNRSYLYQIIKQDLNTTFYDLINSYRLKYAVSLLNNPKFDHLKIVDISEIAGYKNVSTFVTNFKKAYNLTPNEWRNTRK